MGQYEVRGELVPLATDLFLEDKCNVLHCESWLPFGVHSSVKMSRSRTFMRSLVSQSAASLLLFDEPSASLDPTAEHGENQVWPFMYHLHWL